METKIPKFILKLKRFGRGGVNGIIIDADSLAKSDDIALICYEKPSDFCHRHLVADWLIERGFDVEEYDFTK